MKNKKNILFTLLDNDKVTHLINPVNLIDVQIQDEKVEIFLKDKHFTCAEPDKVVVPILKEYFIVN